MERNPIVIIADPETHDFYHAMPLWSEQVEIYPVPNPPRHNGPLRADLVLIDCAFDDVRGLRLLREVKLSHPEIPVMFVTDAGSEKTAVAAFRGGALDYIKKPVDILEFRNDIANFLTTKRAGFRDALSSRTRPDTLKVSDVPTNLLRSIRYIKENFDKPITLDLMAQEGGLSKCHFCREFKKATGMTPMHFLSRMRIKRAKDLLSKDLPISSIAMKIGFNDLSSFNRNFKMFVGLTPTEFRNSLGKDS